MGKKDELIGSGIPGKSDIKESVSDIAAIAVSMVSKGGITDLTKRNGAESKEIIGRKKEGVDPGLLTNKGMYKLGKNLLSRFSVYKS